MVGNLCFLSLVRQEENEKWNEPRDSLKGKMVYKCHSISHSLLSTSELSPAQKSPSAGSLVVNRQANRTAK